MPGDRIMYLKIRRLKCRNCEKIHHELPDIIVPYKRHCEETIEDIVAGTDLNVCCYESTISRIKEWWTAFQLFKISVLGSLNEKFGIDLTTEKKLAKIVRALVNTHSWPGTRSALTPGET